MQKIIRKPKGRKHMKKKIAGILVVLMAAMTLAGCGGQELDSTADQYVGQRLTVSIDPDRTQWPSDSSLPVVQPHTNDVQIIP